jgi:hypothetical protein
VGGRTPPDFASGNGCRRLSPVGWSVSETGARGGRRTPAAIPGTPFHRLPYPPVTEASRPTGIASTVGRRTIDPHATGSQTQVNVQRTRFRHFFQQARATPDLALTRVSRVFSSLEAHGWDICTRSRYKAIPFPDAVLSPSSPVFLSSNEEQEKGGWQGEAGRGAAGVSVAPESGTVGVFRDRFPGPRCGSSEEVRHESSMCA